jgi:very-short-patch-repair endonuclease
VLSHASAAAYWGLQLVHKPDVVHVSVPHGARPAPQVGVQLHQSTLADEDVRDDIVTSPLRTVLDCATALPFREALAVADSALAHRFVQPDQLTDAATATRGRGRPRRIAVARHADRRAENALESALRGTLIERGFDDLEPQHELRARGVDWHVDLGDPLRRIAVEAEGYQTHGTRKAFAEDCERYDEFVRLGWLVVRFAWEHVMFREAWVGDVVGDVRGLRSR